HTLQGSRTVVGARLRTSLHLPTPTAIRINPVLRGFFAGLVAAGEPKMRARSSKISPATAASSCLPTPPFPGRLAPVGWQEAITALPPPKNCTCNVRRIQLKPPTTPL